MDELVFRKAVLSDLPFLVTAVKAAEQLSGQSSSYERIFSLSTSELDLLLSQALSIDGSGYQLTLSTFFVYARGDVPVACCSSWFEAADGIPSGFKLMALLCDLLGFEKWIAARDAVKAFADANPQRTAGALQMETFFVEPNSRRQGLVAQIINSVIRHFDQFAERPRTIEITMLEGGTEPLGAYQKAGFHIHRTGTPGNALFHRLTGKTGFIQLQKTIGT